VLAGVLLGVVPAPIRIDDRRERSEWKRPIENVPDLPALVHDDIDHLRFTDHAVIARLAATLGVEAGGGEQHLRFSCALASDEYFGGEVAACDVLQIELAGGRTLPAATRLTHERLPPQW
jgi:hypothetical protein